MSPIDFSKENHNAGRFAHDLFPKFFKILEVKERYKRIGPDKHLYLKDELVAYAELEVKRVWITKEWNSEWSTIQFPERKGKFATDEYWEGKRIKDALPRKPVFLVMFNHDGSNGLIVDVKTVAESPCPCLWSRRGAEHFYQVPVEKVLFGPENFESYIRDYLNTKI